MSETASTRRWVRMSPEEAKRRAKDAAEALVRDFPELADDPEAFSGTLDGECDALDVAAALIEGAQNRDEHAKDLEFKLAARKDTADRLRERRDRFKRQADRLREEATAILVACCVEGAPRPRLVRSTFTASLRDTASSQRKLLEIDANQTPAEYLVFPPPVPDKDKIRTALQGGKTVPGWELSNDPGPSLQVRVK